MVSMTKREQASWTINLGRWGGLEIRLHLFLFLFAIFTLYMAYLLEPDHPGSLQLAGISLGVLIFSVLIHELGHCAAAGWLGSPIHQIVLAPHGGMGSLRTSANPRAELAILIAGPAFNLLACVICVLVLHAYETNPNILGLLHPLQPTGLTITPGNVWPSIFRLAVWVNWVLFLLNLLPAFPFDGGKALRAGLSICWPDISRQSAAGLVAGMAKIAAVALFVLTWATWSGSNSATDPVPNWVAMLILGVFLYFSAKQEELRSQDAFDEEYAAYPVIEEYADDLDDLATPYPEEQEEPFVDWLEKRREAEIESTLR